MTTLKRAPVRDLDGDLDGSPLSQELLVKEAAKVAVARYLHYLPQRHYVRDETSETGSTSPMDKSSPRNSVMSL